MARVYIVNDGDCLSSITARFGFRSYHTVYDDPANQRFRARRPVPNELVPGDQLAIPDREQRDEAAGTGKRHVYRVASERTFLRLRIRYRGPVDYELSVGDQVVTGTTDGQSLVELPIPPDATSGLLRLWAAGAPHDDDTAIEHPLSLGRLSPLDTVPGLQGRLQNLGFYDGPLDGSLTPATRAAIAAFETSLGLRSTGQDTPALRALLAREHDA
ncbi:MAG: peptidoglycan-binding domain-containing protein [Byssovorax sp.]